MQSSEANDRRVHNGGNGMGFVQELVVVSARLDTVEHKIEERRQELSQLPAEQRHTAKEEIQHLKHKRDKLHHERQAIDSKLHEGQILSSEEERR